MHRGTIKKWYKELNYGFVAPDEKASFRDFFVHQWGLVGCEALSLGDEVTFDIGRNNQNGRVCAECSSALANAHQLEAGG